MKLPLPIYKSIKIKEEGDFYVVVGLDKNLVAQLEKYSADENDTELQQNTSDKKRFVDRNYEDWYAKNRTPFALVHNKTGVMAAIIRFGPEPLHEGCKCHTVGWRSYKPFRGTGIMKGFTKFAFDFYLEQFPNTKFWITAKKDNIGSIKLAEFLGFLLKGPDTDESRIIMTKEL
jgi:RimJ/RimL family protein N-acetyltransferase